MSNKYRYRATHKVQLKIKKVSNAEEKRKAAERQRIHREKKKYRQENLDVEPDFHIYKTKQSFFKAVNRVRRQLPKDNERKKVVLRELLKEFDPSTHQIIARIAANYRRSNVLREKQNSLCKKIESFYSSDEISYQTPGVSDVMVVKNANGKRATLQKRYVCMTLKEAYQEYRKDHPKCVLGISSFFELRPKHILLVSDTPKNVCVCQYHANFEYICKSLRLIPGFPNTYKDVLSEMCCDKFSLDCMVNICTKCETDINDILPLFFNKDTYIHWKQWKKEADTKRIKLQSFLTPASDVITELNKQIKKFKFLFYVNSVQSNYFKHLKSNLNENEFVVQMDFAKNFALFDQDEVQAAHFSYDQVTIFTTCIWTKSEHYSIAIVSNEMNHDKFSVWCFLNKIINFIGTKSTSLKKLAIFTDDCTSQFKNRFILAALPKLQNDIKVPVTWSFFATSHGKDAVDGVGAAIKRYIKKCILSRKFKIETAYDFAEVSSKGCEGVNVFYIDKEKIEETRNLLTKNWSTAKKIPNLLMKHHFEVNENKLYGSYVHNC